MQQPKKKFSKNLALNTKLYKCPHCHKIGFLNFHGCLKGYLENSRIHKFIRARRLYCSKRGLKQGCGKTTTIYLSKVIRQLKSHLLNIRSLLIQRKPPPQTQHTSPLIQTLTHLFLVFPKDPIIEFQQHFQRTIL